MEAGLQTVLTLGHGTASAAELGDLIRGAAIDLVLDVRTVPQSRRHPHFSKTEMERWVPQLSGSAYRWQPALGGFRKANRASSHVMLRHPAFRAYADYMETEPFAAALSDLLTEAAHQRTAIMCSETVWWGCHRRLISDALARLHGVEVRHLMHDGKLRPHFLTAGLRVTDERKLRYDVLFEDGA